MGGLGGFRNIAVAVTGDIRSLSQSLHQGGAEVDAFGNRVERSNTRQAQSWLKSAAAVATVVVSLHAAQIGFDATVGAAAAFEQRMRNVNSISHLSEGALGALGARTLALSRDLPQSANTLAEGLYDIASSGFQGAQGLTVLEASAEAASAGLTTTANSAKAITAVLNAYGLSAASSRDVSDSLFQTVNVGVVSFEELTGVIGDVVGTAAAASVDINQVGAAVATMTLSGISAAEAGTSLNRVLQSIIQPSEALTAQLHALGYESGEQALRADGLRGVMEKLRDATGGNVTALLQLFPEIRAARGALALMSDEGRNYAKVSRQIEDADARQGATRRALNEQLKAVSAQWQLFENRAQAAGIEAGTKLLPVVLDLMHGAERLGSQGLPLLNEGFEHLRPLLSAVAGITGDLFGLLGDLAQAAAPVAGALVAIAAPPLVAGLTALAQAIGLVTGFLAQHETVAVALAAAYAATLLPSIASLTVLFNRLILTPVVLFLASVAGGAGTAASGVAGLTTAWSSLVSVQTVATAGLVAAVLAWVRYADVQRQVKDALGDTGKAIKEGTLDALQDQRKELERTRVELEHTVAAYQDSSFISRFFQTFTGGASAAVSASNALAQVDAAIGRVDISSEKAQNNLARFLHDTLSPEAFQDLLNNPDRLQKALREVADEAADLGVNVNGAYSGFKPLFDRLQDQTGLTAKTITENFGNSVDAVEALQKALDDAAKAASDSFFQATDIISTFDPTSAQNDLTDATKRQHDAQRDLGQLIQRQAADKTRTISDDQRLADARRKVAEATTAVRDAQAGVTASSLQATYDTEIQQAQTFVNSIQKVTRRGLDPEFVARLLKEGPEKAGPVLQALVGDHSRRLIQMANESEDKLREINARVVEFSRLTTLAVSATTDQMTRDLGSAMAIASAQLASGGKKTATELAKSLHIPKAEVARIAEEFGITLQKELDKQHPSVNVRVKSPSYQNLLDSLAAQDALGPRVPPVGRAAGGKLSGPGTGTSDNLHILASPGEWVIQERASSYYGDRFMAAINARVIPREALPGFRDGGPVAGPSVVTVRLPSTESTSFQTPIHIEHMHGGLDEVDRRARLEQLRQRQASGRSMP